MDVPLDKVHCLKNALDGLEGPVATFLEHASPDWIIHDVIAYWVPRVAAKLGVPCALFSAFPPNVYAFFGPPSGFMGSHDAVLDPEKLAVVPSWIPFPSTLAFRRHEAVVMSETFRVISSGMSDVERFGLTVQGCHIVAIRDCMEFGSEWLHLLEDLCQKPVLPVGLLPPLIQESKGGEDETWADREWLDKQAGGSTVYVAFGSEVKLSREQVHELGLGLELSGLPFIWALRTGPQDPDMLPVGFEERLKGRGVVRKGWVPQLRILAHPSIGGFLTHGGWSSIIEALGLGRPLILLPLLYDQGLNVRIIVEKRIGLEVPRDEKDGSFTGDAVAKSLRLVMVEADGEPYRANSMKMKEVFADHELQDRYVDAFIRYLRDHRHQHRLSSPSS